MGRYLKLFTFIPIPEIDKVMAEHALKPHERKAQHLLAREFIELVHGEPDAAAAEQQHRSIFQKTPLLVAANNAADVEEYKKGPTPINQTNTPVVNITLPMSLIVDKAPGNVLYSAGLVSSRGEGHRLATNQGAYIGSKPGGGGDMGDALTFSPIKTWDPSKTKDYLLEGNLLILRAGKWRIKIIRVISDEEFLDRGLDAPGWHSEQLRQKRKQEDEEEARLTSQR